ncbi:MAG: HAD family hydrolase [Candidatus Delongbacteria bacterium]|jgi:Cof subfamily protein (haloacid dehalogenase superfamily)|nr:HAD family hydrolase [Candidatus Delongbacteria bacterium]
MNKTLYITDLDGTLLNSKPRVSEYSLNKINSLIEKGMNFTIATARSHESAAPLIAELDLRLPIILHNGVFVYDPLKQKYIHENFIRTETVQEIIRILSTIEINPIIFTKSNKNFYTYYKGFQNPGGKKYIKSRLSKNDKRFRLVSNFDKALSEKIITLIIIDRKNKLEEIHEKIKDEFDLNFLISEDVYSVDSYWLEITTKNSTKKDAILFLKKHLKAEKTICFGDNTNDISMFEIADESYAVENAVQELKDIATDVIDSNKEDGVARFLEMHYNEELK